jgi:hypothetical protein
MRKRAPGKGLIFLFKGAATSHQASYAKNLKVIKLLLKMIIYECHKQILGT